MEREPHTPNRESTDSTTRFAEELEAKGKNADTQEEGDQGIAGGETPNRRHGVRNDLSSLSKSSSDAESFRQNYLLKFFMGFCPGCRSMIRTCGSG